MTEREALKLVLDVLVEINKLSVGENAICLPAEIDTAMDAAKEALAQPKQGPGAWAHRVIGGWKWLSIHASKGASDKWLEFRIKKQAQGEEYEQVELYTLPPQREWVGLTDGEIETLIHRFDGDPHTLLDEVSARLKKRNT